MILHKWQFTGKSPFDDGRASLDTALQRMAAKQVRAHDLRTPHCKRLMLRMNRTWRTRQARQLWPADAA
jgi:hypothetical protein